MAINKNRVMEAAQKFVEKGHLDKAIKEYQKIVEEDPRDVRVWLKLGDLHAKKGAKQEATETYLRVAGFYSDQGFYLKAVAVYKQVLRLDPRLIDVNIRLAEVYRQLGLLSDAMQQYELVAAFYHREGKTREALATVRELVELDPENVATRIKLAELYSKEQMVKEAVSEFGKAAETLRASNRMDDFIKVAERLVWHQPDNHAMNRELAQLYLRRNDPRHALQKLQVCFKADPRDCDTLALLASAFLALDQRQKTVSVWKELARIHGENNQPALAQDVYRRILSVSPDDADALAAAGGRRAVGTGNPPAVATQQSAPAPTPQPPPQPAASPPPRGLATPIGSEPSDRPLPRLATPMRAPEPPLVTMKGPARVATPIAHAPTMLPPPLVSARPAAVSDGIAIEIDEEREQTTRQRPEPVTLDVERRTPATSPGWPSEIAKLIDQADTYAKYGLRDKAAGQLHRVLEIDPRSVDARARLKDTYLALGRGPDAANELVRLVELLAPTDRERAQGYLRELVEVAPQDGRGDELVARYRLRPPGEVVGPDSDDLEIEIVQGGVPHSTMQVDSVDVLLESSAGVDETTDIGVESMDSDDMTAIGDGTMEIDAELAVEVAAPGDDDIDHELAFDDMTSARAQHGGGDQTVDVSRAPFEDFPSMTVEPVDPLDPLDSNDDDAIATELSLDPTDEALAESLGPPSVRAVADAQVNDFEAPSATERPQGLARESGGTSLEDDLDEADFFVSQSLYDEARAILGDLLSRHPNHPLIVAKMRDLPGGESDAASSASRSGSAARRPAVIARPQGGTDADTHYDLGMAYKEMGLHEEALKEFALARQAPGRAVQSYLMIGLCQLELGRVSEAVEAFKAGLYVDGINDREALAVYFELGAAYETLGDAREALYYYEKVQKRDPRFRDVEQRVAVLSGGGDPLPVRGNGSRDRRVEAPSSRNDARDVSDDALSALDSLLDERDVTPS